jgi:4-amino-4-deoxychorismate lyase
LITPELETCGVHGVIREQIIKKVDTWSVKIKRENFTKQRLLEADAVFMTNSIFWVWPVRSFEKRSWEPHPLIPRLLAALGFPA